ncbi:MAG TPA: DUF5615 family PIN-like protein [Chloroflexota bacterium]|jgi:hypothetical protein|nr:DUF5615 family PIN-like protein [Chloroflexota bacterium]
MPAPPALLDECMDVALVPALRARGFDVVSLQTVGPRSVDDALALERAVQLGRVLVTQNTNDFKAAHAVFLHGGRGHPGIICVPQRGPLSRRALRLAMMLDWVGAQDHASRLYVWGELQQLLERRFHLPGYDEEDVRQVLGRR